MEPSRPAKSPEPYVPALHFRRLTPLYDPVLRWAFHEGPLKARLVALADLRPGGRVLDVGCGTGTLTILLKVAQPAAAVVALDGDPEVLRIARSKAAAAGVEVQWDRGFAFELPYPEASFDIVVASLVLHHLRRETRVRALAEVARVLRAGGTFLAAEFGPPLGGLQRALAKVGELLEPTADGVEGRLPAMFAQAGLEPVEMFDRFRTPLGTLALYRTHKAPGRPLSPPSAVTF